MKKLVSAFALLGLAACGGPDRAPVQAEPSAATTPGASAPGDAASQPAAVDPNAATLRPDATAVVATATLDPRAKEAFDEGVGLAASKPEEALEAFDRARKSSPGFANAHFNAGAILAAQGKLAAAEQAFAAAVSADPKLAPAVAGVDIDFIESVAGNALDAELAHARLRAGLRAMISAAVSAV